MKDLMELSKEIGEWSTQNFGEQESKLTPGHTLGSVAPFLGIVEELGELLSAETIPEMIDAISDCGIYSLDYLYREKSEHIDNIERGLPKQHSQEHLFCSTTELKDTLEDLMSEDLEEVVEKATEFTGTRMSILIGELSHVILKGHQGIRGYDVKRKYTSERDELMEEIFQCLDSLCEYLSIVTFVKNGQTIKLFAKRVSLVTCINYIWEKIVAKRNWKQHKEEGN